MSQPAEQMAAPSQPVKRPMPKWLKIAFPVAAFGGICSLIALTLCGVQESVFRIHEQINLRRIGLALRMYADDHGDTLPPDWATLVANQELTKDLFVSQSNPATSPAPGTQPAEWGKYLDDPHRPYNSFRYAAAGLKFKDLKPDDILAFQFASDHFDAGLNILCADGHVDWHNATGPDRARYDRLLADYAAGVRPLRWKE